MPTLNEAKLKYSKLQLKDAASQLQLVAKLNEYVTQLGWNSVTPAANAYPTGTVVSSAQTGNANSTVYDFGNMRPRQQVLVRIVTTVGATPTCTYAIQGSSDNSTFTALNYADLTTPFTVVSSTFVLTTAGTTVKVVQANQQYRYLRVTYSANTNVTNTTDIYPLGDLYGTP